MPADPVWDSYRGPCRVDGCPDPADHPGSQMCDRHYRRVRRTGEPGPPGPALSRIRLDAEPLIVAVGQAGGIGRTVAAADPSQRAALRRGYYRAAEAGTVSAAMVARFATLLGTHPADIYGLVWWQTAER